MRISSWRFKSTPKSSLQDITEEPPLQTRSDNLSLKYYYKVKSLLQNPNFKFSTPEKETLSANKKFPPPFAIRFQIIHIRICIRIFRRLQKWNGFWNGSYHRKPYRIILTSRISLYINCIKICITRSSEYNICNIRNELLYYHRLKKQPISSSKANSDQPKGTKAEAHHT